MTDFRKIESELIEFFEAAGVDVKRHDGDTFAVVAPIVGCELPRNCEAQFTDGKIYCDCAVHTCPNPIEDGTSLSLTKLAERLAGK
jgi:hypothetical protein